MGATRMYVAIGDLTSKKTISFLNCDAGLLTIALLAMLIYLLHVNER